LDVVAHRFYAAEASLLALAWRPIASELEAPELKFLLQYWEKLCNGEPVPRADRVSPFDMRPVLGHVVLVDAIEDGHNGRFRLFGSKVAQRAGADLTGKLIADLDGGSYLAEFARALHRAVFVRREPVFAAHQPAAAISATGWQWLILPLAEAGQAVTRYLVGMVPVPARPVV
jgi:hypothetical protein